MARDAFRTNFFCYAEKICKQAERFDADEILNDAEAELYNSASNCYDEMPTYGTTDYLSNFQTAMLIDW